MKRHILPVAIFALLAWSGCSKGPSQTESATAAIPLDKIQGKAQKLIEQGGATDAALNAGGESIYIWVGLHRYRLFLKAPVEIEHGKQYVVEGIHAQKVIDEIGDPQNGKSGYPLVASAERAVKRAWPNLSMDGFESTVSLVRARLKRYPARPLFLVTKIRSASAEEAAAAPPEAAKPGPEVVTPADKQRALLLEGATVLPAPLWEPQGGVVTCKLVLGANGQVDELETGKQLCEAVPWSTFRYKPTLKGGKPARVNTEVEIRFEPRKT
jgi:hypothetical protein